jgi:hypothetical protein
MKRLPIQQPQVFVALKQATIHQDAPTIVLDQVL